MSKFTKIFLFVFLLSNNFYVIKSCEQDFSKEEQEKDEIDDTNFFDVNCPVEWDARSVQNCNTFYKSMLVYLLDTQRLRVYHNFPFTDGIQEYTKLERLGCLKKLSKMAEKCSFKRTSKMVKTVIEDFSKTETRFSLAPFEDVYWTTPMHKRKNLKKE